jgi:NTP pyrophosphatase (non-canonical NTP hydrolase)
MVSLTLRDAQHVCWKTLRMINDRIEPEKGRMWTPLVTIADLRASCENVAQFAELEKLEEQKNAIQTRSLAAALSDVLYAVFVLAEHYKLNIEDVFMETMNDRMIAHLH